MTELCMTRDELYAVATQLDIEGRSSMTKEELETAITAAGKKGISANRTTPIIPDPPEHPRPVSSPGTPADQTSGGGTITGADTVTPAVPGTPGTTL